jgi:hypothetical protein
VCLDNWTSKGAHRIVVLACGHLFGDSCITKWVKVSGQLPQNVTHARPVDAATPFIPFSLELLVMPASPFLPPPVPSQANKRCPQCNQPARTKDVRPVFVTNIVAVDGTALAAAEAAVEQERKAKQAVS